MASNLSRGAPNASVLGLFPDQASASRAIDDLERQGITRQALSVMSSVPFADGIFGTDTSPSRVPYFSVVGAIGGLVVGIALAAGTALLYPLPTGGKPIIALPTVGIIAYELTMLGIIALTLFGVLFEMRLPRVKKPPYDPRISEGYVGLLVPCPAEEQVVEYEDALRRSGAVDIRRFDGT